MEKLEIYTRPGKDCLNYQIGILLITNCDFMKKFLNMRIQNRIRIIELLNFHRIAIWNINVPLPLNGCGGSVKLSEDCLKIIRINNFENNNII